MHENGDIIDGTERNTVPVSAQNLVKRKSLKHGKVASVDSVTVARLKYGCGLLTE